LGILERKERQKQGLRQEILSAALDVFATQGYQQLSMRRLAEKIEYSPTTIYLHFKDKAALFECVCEQTFSRLSELFERIMSESSDPLKALRQSCRAYIDFGLDHPNEYKVAFLLDSGQQIESSALLSKLPLAIEVFSQLRRGVGDCMRAGQLAEADPDLVSQVIWSNLHGITALLIVKSGFPWCDKDRLIDLIIETTLKSFTHSRHRAGSTSA
jgi:AcrR family transcriptional regulator